jgi:hypothetical protein
MISLSLSLGGHGGITRTVEVVVGARRSFFYRRENVRLLLRLHAVREFSYRAFSEYIVSCNGTFTDEFVTFIGPFLILSPNIPFAEYIHTSRQRKSFR